MAIALAHDRSIEHKIPGGVAAYATRMPAFVLTVVGETPGGHVAEAAAVCRLIDFVVPSGRVTDARIVPCGVQTGLGHCPCSQCQIRLAVNLGHLGT